MKALPISLKWRRSAAVLVPSGCPSSRACTIQEERTQAETGSPPARSSEVPRDSAAFSGSPCRVVRHHAAGLPVPGEHHVGGGRSPARQLRCQPDASRVRGHPALEAGSHGGGREPQPHHLRRQRHHPVARLRIRGGAQRAKGARNADQRHADPRRRRRRPVAGGDPAGPGAARRDRTAADRVPGAW